MFLVSCQSMAVQGPVRNRSDPSARIDFMTHLKFNLQLVLSERLIAKTPMDVVKTLSEFHWLTGLASESWHQDSSVVRHLPLPYWPRYATMSLPQTPLRGRKLQQDKIRVGSMTMYHHPLIQFNPLNDLESTICGMAIRIVPNRGTKRLRVVILDRRGDILAWPTPIADPI